MEEFGVKMKRPGELAILGTVLLAYRGSVAHNMYVPKNDPKHIDDVDLMGVVVGEPKHYLGLQVWNNRGTLEVWDEPYDVVHYEIKKMFQLLLQGNPNVLSLLWLPEDKYVVLEEAGRALVENRNLFVGKHVYHSFAGYASAQLQKMESRDPGELRLYLAVTAELKYRGIHPNCKGEFLPRPNCIFGEALDVYAWSNEKLIARLRSFQKNGDNIGYLGDKRKRLIVEHGYDAKNASHSIRLLKMAKEFLADGSMEVFRTKDVQELLDIKAGKWPLEQIKEYAKDLFEQVKAQFNTSTLPGGPDEGGAEDLLVELIKATLFGVERRN